MDRDLLSDRDWERIEGQLCLVSAFTPMARVKDGKVTAIARNVPYASVELTCANQADTITGFIRHRTDFLMLWAAFRRRAKVPGTRLEILSSAVSAESLGEDEEVWLVWTRRNYTMLGRLLSWFSPRLVVMVSQKGAFQLVTDREGRLRPDLGGEPRYRAEAPLAIWTPLVMRE